MTLVLDTNAAKVRLLWAEILSADLQSAKEALREREGIPGADWSSRIGTWQRREPAAATIPDLPQWEEALGLGAVICEPVVLNEATWLEIRKRIEEGA